MTVCPKVVVVFELNVTATVDTAAAQPVGDVAGAADEAALVVVVDGLLDAGGFGVVPEPEPVMAMSAQVK